MKKNILLKKFSTMKTGGRASMYFEISEVADFDKVLEYSEKLNLPIVVIGGGSNILISDNGVKAIVIKLMNSNIEVINETKDYIDIKVGGGKNWDELVKWTVDNGLYGIECLSHIPGTVGAAPVQNIGAYGQEVKDTILGVNVYDINKKQLYSIDNPSCKFSYRDSIFKNIKYKQLIVFEVIFRFSKNKGQNISYDSLKKYLFENNINDPSLYDIREAVINIRNQKLEDPNNIPNTGSFFKNPVITQSKFESLKKKFETIPSFQYKENLIKIPAGWLIEQTGWKGRKYKNVGVSDKHALVLINPKKKGTTNEIMELANKIISDVNDKFGIKLEMEVEYIS